MHVCQYSTSSTGLVLYLTLPHVSTFVIQLPCHSIGNRKLGRHQVANLYSSCSVPHSHMSYLSREQTLSYSRQEQETITFSLSVWKITTTNSFSKITQFW